MTVPKCFFANKLTGNTDGCLDAIDGSLIVSGDAAYVALSSGDAAYFYRLVDQSGQTASSPERVRPIINAGNKMWNRLPLGIPNIKFSAKRSTIQTITATNVWQDIVFDSEISDTANAYSASTGVFTAPVTGYYDFSWDLQIDSIDTASSYYALQLVTSNRTFTYLNMINSSTMFSADCSFNHMAGTVLSASMTAGNTAKLQIMQYSGTGNQTQIHNRGSFFYGHYVV